MRTTILNMFFRLFGNKQTTYENFRYRYDKKANPYNRGVIHNIKEVLFSKTVPSLVNFREWVTEEDDDMFAESITKKFGGDIMKSNMKVDLELGIGKDGKAVPNILQGLDYNGIDESLKKDRGGKIADDPFFLHHDQEDKYGSGDSSVDDGLSEDSSRRISSVVLHNR